MRLLQLPRGKWQKFDFKEEDGEKEVMALHSAKLGMKLKFQVAAVNKPLLSVKRIVEQGNSLHFGQGKEDSCTVLEMRRPGTHWCCDRMGKGPT